MRRLCAALLLAASVAAGGELPQALSQTRPAKSVLWRDPGDVARLDFRYGVGGRAREPRPPFRFLKEDLSGSNPKIQLKDARGAVWSVKWSNEAQPEVFASRVAWACGYITQPEYFVPSGRITGARNLKRAAALVAADGTFRDARFQLRTKSPKFLTGNSWSWVNNPFIGTRELNGLKVVMMLLSDWDNKDARDIDRDSNVAIFEERRGGRPVYLYFIADWGASMGKWGHVYNRDKWDCKGFAKQTPDFVKGVHHDFVEWGYVGQRTGDATKNIRVSDVRWLLRYLGRIHDSQLRAGLRASGATPAEVECFTRALRNRIVQLQRLAAAR